MIEVAQTLVDSLNMHTQREDAGEGPDVSKSKDDTKARLEVISSKLHGEGEIGDDERMKLVKERMKLDRVLEIRSLEERLAELKSEDIDDEGEEEEEEEEEESGTINE